MYFKTFSISFSTLLLPYLCSTPSHLVSIMLINKATKEQNVFFYHPFCKEYTFELKPIKMSNLENTIRGRKLNKHNTSQDNLKSNTFIGTTDSKKV